MSFQILSHSKQICCNVCNGKYHMKCLTLFPDEQRTIPDNISIWMCQFCHQSVFPFNWLDDDEFLCVIRKYSSEYLQLYENIDDVLQISESDEENTRLPIYDIDQDQNFYNDYIPIMNSDCKYFNEDFFNDNFTKTSAKHRENPVSFCPINIRSAPKNLSSFEHFLTNLKCDFTSMGLTEIWLTEYNEHLYNISGYDSVGNYRREKKLGGISLNIQWHLKYNTRNDLCIFNDIMESHFIELDKHQLALEKI